MQRLAALVPRPRLHLIRFHGVLAPRARPREGPAWRVEDAAPSYVPTSSLTHRSTPTTPPKIILTRPGPRHRPASAGLSYSNGYSVSILNSAPVRRLLDDPRRHPRTPRHRQAPRPSRLTYPQTAARPRAALRAPPNRLIANQYPIPRGSARLKPTAPFGPRPRATPNRPENRRLGWRTGPQIPQFSSVTSRH